MKLREIRKQHNKSQKMVATDLNLNNTTYSNYEIGKREPDIKMLCKLADYFGVSLDYLCERKTHGLGDFGYLNPDQMQAVDILLSLPESKFYEILGRLKNMADNFDIKY